MHQMSHLLTGTRQEQQHTLLSRLACFAGAEPRVLDRLAEHCRLRACTPNTRLLQERSAEGHLYVVVQGQLRLFLRDRAHHRVLVGTVGPGECVGEHALFGEMFSGATIEAETSCLLLMLPTALLREMLADAPQFAARLRSIHRQRTIERGLGRVPLFSQLALDERRQLAPLMREQHYDRGELVLQEGQLGAALSIIETGQAVVERDGQVIAHLDEGDFFGELSLLTRRPHNADVRALTPLDVLTLPADVFHDVLAQQPALARQLDDLATLRLRGNQQPPQSASIGLAVERGMLRGTHLLVRDHARCDPGCQRCEQACATRFGAPRLRVGPMMFDAVEVVDACRQCRVGPECVEACPEHAIRWSERGVLVITDACTGCGDCVPACPYHMIEMTEPPDAGSPLHLLMRQMKRHLRPIIPLEGISTTMRASKCDLCANHSDMACVSACPTGALRLVPVEEIFPL